MAKGKGKKRAKTTRVPERVPEQGAMPRNLFGQRLDYLEAMSRQGVHVDGQTYAAYSGEPVVVNLPRDPRSS